MRHFFFIICLSILTNVFSQEAEPYRKLIGTDNANQQCNSALMSTDSFFYIAGSEYNNFFLAKVNQNGDTLWTQNWGGVNVSDYLKCIIETSDNNLIMLGKQKSRTPNNSSNDLYISKNSKETGEIIWFQQYGGEEDEIPESIIQTTDKGFVILATVRASTGNQSILIKIDSEGNRLWTKSLSQIGNIKGTKLLALKENKFVFIGTITQYEGSDQDIIFIKFNKDGESVLKKIYNEKLNEQPFDILHLPDNGFIIAGKASSIDRFNFNYNGFFLRIDSIGISSWYKTWNNVHVRSVILTDDENIVAGCSFRYEGFYNSLAFKFSIDDGSKIWSKLVGDKDWESNSSDIIELSDNSLVLFSNTRKSTGFYYIMMSKLNSDGTWSDE